MITYNSGYTYLKPIPSNPIVSINAKTGMLKVNPTMQGQFTIGVMVKEFRKGKQIGATRRDYQLNVQDCVFETTSAFITPEINCERELTFTNNSQNAVRYAWDFGDTTISTDTSSQKNAYYKYSKPGTYTITLIAYGTNCYDSITKTITILDRLKFKLPADQFTCKAINFKLQPDTFYTNAKYLWSTGSTDSSIMVNALGKYWLNIQWGACSTTDTIEFNQDSTKVSLSADTLTCDPVSHHFKCDIRVNQLVNQVDWFYENNSKSFSSEMPKTTVYKPGLYQRHQI